jgi:hypothetical protein
VGKGAKIAIGCAAVVVLVGIVALVFLGVGAYWLKGKAEQVTGDLAQTATDIDKYQREANAHPFSRPVDGAFTEDRLLKFLDVRKEVYGAYMRHQDVFKAMETKKEAGLGDYMKMGGLIADVKLAQAKGQAAAGMSDDEYLFMVQSVYGAAMSSTMQRDTGKTPSEAASESMAQISEALRAGAEAARKAGGTSPSDEEIQKSMEQLRNAQATTMNPLDAPQSNIDLYRKHEAEIKKYTMEGLALIGL